jgi:hypothetical protein
MGRGDGLSVASTPGEDIPSRAPETVLTRGSDPGLSSRRSAAILLSSGHGEEYLLPNALLALKGSGAFSMNLRLTIRSVCHLSLSW